MDDTLNVRFSAHINWCSECKIPLIISDFYETESLCPLCKNPTKYLAKDLRPVFPEEKLLLELLLEKNPHDFTEKSVWCENSRYFIDGRAKPISSKTFETADCEKLKNQIEEHN